MPKHLHPRLLTLTIFAVITLCGACQLADAASPAYEQALIQRAETLFGTGDGFQAGAEPTRPIKCGTPLVYEIRMAWPELSAETREHLSAVALTDRPVLDESYDFETAASGRFRIHYTREGWDAIDMSFGVGEGDVPVYILRCAAFVDTVVNKEVVELGYRFPVSDSIGRAGEDPRYDIYFTNLGSRYYGLSFPEEVVERPGGKFVATSWMELNSDYTKIFSYETRPFEAMAVTVAHEFHHAIQWSYDALEAEVRTVGDELELFPWFFEVTSTYMEDVVFDYVNDYYAYLPSFFENPWYSLRLFSSVAGPEGLHCYASAIWGHYLAAQHGHEIMVEIWEECEKEAGFGTFEAFETVLARHGSSFKEEWAGFLVWNYFTGTRSPGSWGYEEGDWYPAIPDTHIALYETFPVEDSARLAGTPRRPDELAGAYMRFFPGTTDTVTDFNIQFSAHDFDEWLVVTAGLRGNLEPEIVFTDDVLLGTVTVPNWSQYDEVLVIVSPFKRNPSQDVLDRNIGFNFAVRDSFSETPTVSAVRKMFSNPLYASTGDIKPFKVEVALAEPAVVSMYVYTPSGQLVRGGEEDNDSENQMYWDADRRTVNLWWAGTNRDNQRVASGVYLALVKIGDKTEVIKVAVINK